MGGICFRTMFFWVVICSLCLGCSSVATTDCVELFVSPKGSDANSGRKGEPLATLCAARDTIRALRKDSNNADRSFRVNIRGGRYFLSEPFLLEPQDSGTKTAPVIYEAYKNEKPILSGGVIVDGWKPLRDEPAGVREQAKGKLWVADIEKGWFPHYLYVNAQAQPMSRFPNEGFLEGDEGIREFGDPGPKGQYIRFPESVREYIEYLPSNGDVEMTFLPVIWANSISVMKDFDLEKNAGWRHSKNVAYPGCAKKDPRTDWMRANRFSLHNAVCFIDRPGEWAVDTQKGKIYYWPEQPMKSRDEIICSKLYEIVRMKGNEEATGELVHNIEIRGLTMTQTDRMPEDQWPDEWLVRNFENPDGTIWLEDVCDITIENNLIKQVGTAGIVLRKYAQQVQLLANEIEYAGCGGIQLLGYGPGKKDVNRNNRISRNVIHACGAGDYLHSTAIGVYQSGHNTFTYNYIYDMPYAGIMLVSTYTGNINDVNTWGWIKGKNDEPWMHTDAYGNFESQYRIRWEDFPKGTYERHLAGTGEYTHEELTPYFHTRNNTVQYNVVVDVMNQLKDGGGLYGWCTGKHNRYLDNIVKDCGDKTIYLDVDFAYTSVRGNRCWGKGGTTDYLASGNNYWIDNRFSYPERPAGFYELLAKIIQGARLQGGWPDGVDLQVPAAAIEGEEKLFFYRKLVSVRKLNPKCKSIRYTLDGSEPSGCSPMYEGAFNLTETTTVKAAGFAGSKKIGETDTITFLKIEPPMYPDVSLFDIEHQIVEPNEAPNSWMNLEGAPLMVRNTYFAKGWRADINAKLTCTLQPRFKKFVATIAVDDLSDPREDIVFYVLIDGEQVYESEVMTTQSLPKNIEIEIPQDSNMLELKCRIRNNWHPMFGDWLYPGFQLYSSFPERL